MVQRGDKTDVPTRTDARNRSSVLHRVAAFGPFRGRSNMVFWSPCTFHFHFGSDTVELGDLRIWVAGIIFAVGAIVIFVFFRDR
jgi:hypothetical protein